MSQIDDHLARTKSVSDSLAVAGSIQAVDVAAGLNHTLAINENGECWAWGLNSHGQLGDGSTIRRDSPIKVPLTDVSVVAAGYYHSLAVLKNGECWAFGWNARGQLGNGSKAKDCTEPVQVIKKDEGSDTLKHFKEEEEEKKDEEERNVDEEAEIQKNALENVIAVAAGYHHSLALCKDGSCWAWGWNPHGQLGDGSKVLRAFPVQVKLRREAASVVAGLSHSLVLLKDGSCWAWGSNSSGQLGDGTEVDSTSPVQVQLPKKEKAIFVSAALHHSVAILKNGECWAWGGNRNKLDCSLPVRITNETLCTLGTDEDLRMRLEKLEEQKEAWRKQKIELHREYESLQEAKLEKEIQLENMTEERDDLQHKLEDSEKALSELASELAALRDGTLLDIRRERDSLRKEKASLALKVKELYIRVGRLETEAQRCKKEQQEAEYEMRVAKHESKAKDASDRLIPGKVAGRFALRSDTRVVIKTDYVPTRHQGKYKDGDFAVLREIGYPESSVLVCRTQVVVNDIRTASLQMAPITKKQKFRAGVEATRSLSYEDHMSLHSLYYFGEEMLEEASNEESVGGVTLEATYGQASINYLGQLLVDNPTKFKETLKSEPPDVVSELVEIAEIRIALSGNDPCDASSNDAFAWQEQFEEETLVTLLQLLRAYVDFHEPMSTETCDFVSDGHLVNCEVWQD